MRFTHYMQYFVDLEGGKLIPVSVLFWRPMCDFPRGVLNTIYSTSWRSSSAHRVCPSSTLHSAKAAFWEGLPTSALLLRAAFGLKIATFLVPRSIICGRPSRAEPGRARPGRAEPSRGEPGQDKPSRAEPNRRSTEPAGVIHPNTRSPANAAEYVTCSFIFIFIVMFKLICIFILVSF